MNVFLDIDSSFLRVYIDISRLPAILAELEQDARRLANSVQHMMETLSSQLHNVSITKIGFNLFCLKVHIFEFTESFQFVAKM